MNRIVQKLYSYKIRIHKKTTDKILDEFMPGFYKNKTKNIKTILIIIGSYRNLTTLVASIMSLHPNCQVLNHAGRRVIQKNKLDFLNNSNAEKINNFLNFAIYASQYGKRGSYGGAIFHSHAYDNDLVRKKYFNRYSSKLKNQVSCIFWKDSQLIMNKIKDEGQLKKIFKSGTEIEIKFIMPIRNSINCVKSNLKTGHYKFYFPSIPPIEKCVEVVFEQYLFFLNMQAEYPNNFMYFFEDEIISILPNLAKFAQLSPDSKWIKDVSDVVRIKGNYENSEELKSKCINLAQKYFLHYPIFKKNLSNY